MTRQLTSVAGPPPRAYALPRGRRFPVVPALVGLGLIVAGIAAAALLTRGGDATPVAKTFVRTVLKTTPGKTITQQTTVTTAPAASAGTSLAQGRRDSDAAFNLIRAANYSAALPLAQQALSELRGTGNIYEGYANYNVGTSLIHLGRCSEGLPYLDASERIQGHRSEFDRDRALCKNR